GRGSTRGEQSEGGLTCRHLTEGPGTGLEIAPAARITFGITVFAIVPVPRQERVIGPKLESQSRMSGGNEIVIDVLARTADMTIQTYSHAVGEAARVIHSAPSLGARETFAVMTGQPALCRAAAAFAAHA